MVRKIVAAAAAGLATLAVATGSAAASSYACSLHPNSGYAKVDRSVGLTPFSGGSFMFEGNATCVIDGVAHMGRIESTGNFDNVICGTGSVYNGHATFSGTRAFAATYHVQFTAMAGVLTIDTVNGNAVTSAGALAIRPKAGTCVTGVSEFWVDGGFAASN